MGKRGTCKGGGCEPFRRHLFENEEGPVCWTGPFLQHHAIIAIV
jgi:hypothetical protein